MNSMILVGVFLLICGISAASFALDKNRSPAGWYVVALVLGPVGLLVLLMLPPLDQPWNPGKLKRVVFAAIGMFLTLVVLGLALIEINAQYHAERRTMYLERWEIYGDALLRFARTNRQSSDALVAKLARDQIREYEVSLKDAADDVHAQLRSAVQGYREVHGIRGFLSNLLRVITFRRPNVPAVRSLSTGEQEELIAELREISQRYQDHLAAIEAFESNWKQR